MTDQSGSALEAALYRAITPMITINVAVIINEGEGGEADSSAGDIGGLVAFWVGDAVGDTVGFWVDSLAVV